MVWQWNTWVLWVFIMDTPNVSQSIIDRARFLYTMKIARDCNDTAMTKPRLMCLDNGHVLSSAMFSCRSCRLMQISTIRGLSPSLLPPPSSSQASVCLHRLSVHFAINGVFDRAHIFLESGVIKRVSDNRGNSRVDHVHGLTLYKYSFLWWRSLSPGSLHNIVFVAGNTRINAI